jgi:peptidoglycan/LPS O-acetylase OafA/YrhL
MNSEINGLDGFRAILVFSVMIFHSILIFTPTHIDLFQGGFFAVESFFVLSGFFITKSLISKHKSSKTSIEAFKKFIKARILRLTPAFVFLSLIQLLTILILFPQKVYLFTQELFYSSLNLYNIWLLIRHIPYFQKFTQTLFYNHFWSLSLEWQFYIAWSILFALLFRINKKYIIILAVIIAALSMVDMYYMARLNEDINRVYYGTDSRFFPFMLGALLAFFEQKIPKHNYMFFITGLASLALLIFSYFKFNEYSSITYPFVFILVDVLTLIFIVSVLKSPIFDKLMSIKPLHYFGIRSYSLYIWHYPIFTILTLIYKNDILASIMMGFILTILAADISYTFIEEPFRRWSFDVYKDFKTKFSLVLNSFLIIVTCSYVGFSHTNQKLNQMPEICYTYAWHPSVNDEVNDKESSYKKHENKSNLSNMRVAVIGDSVILDVKPYLERYLPHVYVNGKVSRQFYRVFDVLKRINLNDYNVFVIELGTNGYVRPSDLKRLIKLLSDKKVYLITTKMPDPWQNEVNNLYFEASKKYPNVKVIDWYSFSKDHPEFFWNDKTHLRPYGAKEYAKLIVKNLEH